MGGRSTARALVWTAFAGQAVFFTSWIVAGALEPHYSHLQRYVSELAARLPRAFLGERALRLPEAGMAVLLDAGFEPAEAATAWRALWSYTFGFATFRATPARSTRAAVDAFAGVVAPDAEFAAGLEPLLDGLALRAGLSRA